MGIATWLVPPPSAFEPFDALIKSLAKQHASPIFQPHITLLSVPYSEAIIADPRSLLPPQDELPSTIPITFKKVCTGKTFFQSVLIEVEPGAKDGPLQSLYDAMLSRNQKHLKSGGGSDPIITKGPYYPHLSLYYGSPPMEEKEAIVKSLIKDGIIDVSETPPIIAGVRGGFDVTEIWVVNCEGPIEGWNMLHKVELAGYTRPVDSKTEI